MVDVDAVKRRFESLLPTVDERMRRLIAAAESLAIDYGGISIVSRATGVSRRAIARGIVELGNPPLPSGGAIRNPGGGRKAHGRTGRDAGEGFGAPDRTAEPW
jgi:DNA-binding phage protein